MPDLGSSLLFGSSFLIPLGAIVAAVLTVDSNGTRYLRDAVTP